MAVWRWRAADLLLSRCMLCCCSSCMLLQPGGAVNIYSQIIYSQILRLNGLQGQGASGNTISRLKNLR